MTATSILAVEVQDEAFTKFLDMFKEYETLLSDMPKEWKQHNAVMASAATAFAASAASVTEMAAALGNAVRGQNQLQRATRQTDTAMGSLAAHAKGVATTIMGVAKALTVGGLLTGLATGVGLFGLDRLAHSVFGQRRTAQGLGVSTGERAAFGVNYGAFVNADSLLGNVANARNDLSQQWAFRALGITPGDEAGMDNADLAREVTRRARETWRNGPHTLQYAQARGLTQFFSMEELRRLGAASDADLAGAESGYGRDRGALSSSDALQREWTRFSIQLRRAGMEIETSLIKGLAPLTPDLTRLSQGVTHLIGAFLGAPAVKKAIDKLAEWLGSPAIERAVNGFADWLGSPAFQADMRAFAEGVGAIAHKIADALRWLGVIPSGDVSAADFPGNPNLTPEQRRTLSNTYQRLSAASSAAGGAPDLLAQRTAQLMAGRTSQAEWQRYINDASGKQALPPGLLWNLFGAESNYGRDLLNPKSGAEGGFQFMPGTAAELGVNPWDAKSSSEGAANYLSILYARFGDWRKAVAAYNWGPANLDADIKAHGGQWEQFAPKETQGELAKVFPAGGDSIARALQGIRRDLAQRPGGDPTRITISNDTSARVAITGAQVAQ